MGRMMTDLFLKVVSHNSMATVQSGWACMSAPGSPRPPLPLSFSLAHPLAILTTSEVTYARFKRSVLQCCKYFTLMKQTIRFAYGKDACMPTHPRLTPCG